MQSSLLPVHKYKKNDERLASVLEQAEPLISFALACGTRSSPAVGPLAPAFLSSSCVGVGFWLSFLFLPTLLSEIFALVKPSAQHMLCVLLLSLVRIKWTLMGFFSFGRYESIPLPTSKQSWRQLARTSWLHQWE